jgi:hypothetical protein
MKKRGHVPVPLICIQVIETVDDDDRISASLLPEQIGERMQKLQ